jgi:NitT/TauT family transport system substrate-binding protein
LNQKQGVTHLMVILLAWLVFMSPAPCGASESLPEINYRLKWLLNTSAAGDIYADSQGCFADNGLKVIVKPGSPERDPIKELELGRAHFGVASADQVIRALSKGAKIKVLAQLFQINPLQWIYRPEKTTVSTPRDLKNKTIGITYGGIDENIMKAVLARAQISESDVDFYSVRYDFTPFYQGRVDLWPIYRNAQGPVIGARMEKAGERIDFFDPDAHGIRTVANSVITSEEIWRNEAQMVEKFMSGLLRGWEMAMDPDNAEKTITLIRQVNKDTSRRVIAEQLDLTRRFIKPDPGIRIGRIDARAWKQTEHMMLDQNMIDKPVNIENALVIR